MTTDLSTPSPPMFDWSDEAKLAFNRATGIVRTPFLNKALNAALAVDAPRLFEQWAEGMIATITTHPVLGGRTLRLKPDERGEVTLRLDADLLRYILFNELPEGLTHEPPPSETEPDTKEGLTDD